MSAMPELIFHSEPDDGSPPANKRNANVWKTKDGRLIPYAHLKNRHLDNIIALLERIYGYEQSVYDGTVVEQLVALRMERTARTSRHRNYRRRVKRLLLQRKLRKA